MDSSFYEDLVGKRFPSPTSSSGIGNLQEGFSGNKLSSKLLEPSAESFLSGAFGMAMATCSGINSENYLSYSPMELVQKLLPWIPVQEDRNSLFTVPLASADTHLPNYFEHRDHWPVSASKPSINIYCHRSCNFAKTAVCFTIQVHSLPRGMMLNENMFGALLATPDGKYEPLFLNYVDNTMVTSFNGCFWAKEEGVYRVMAGFLIPTEFWRLVRNASEDGDFFKDWLDIQVFRNYSQDCREDSLFIDCEYKTTGETGSVQKPWPSRTTNQLDNFQHRNRNCKLWGLTADQRTNNLFYTDRFAGEVICAHPRGQTLFRFGRNGPTNTTLFRPSGISHDVANRRLVIADKDNHRICFFTLDGQYISYFGSKGHTNGMFNYPWDVAVSPDGQHIAVSDSRNKRVQLFDRFDNFLNKYTVYETNPYEYKDHLDYPRGITFDETGKNIYVSDFNLHNVIRIPLDFTHHYKLIPAGELRRPQGIAVNDDGNLLIADSHNYCVRYVTPQGQLISNISSVLDQPLGFPVNVAALAGGFVAVLCETGRIRIF